MIIIVNFLANEYERQELLRRIVLDQIFTLMQLTDKFCSITTSQNKRVTFPDENWYISSNAMFIKQTFFVIPYLHSLQIHSPVGTSSSSTGGSLKSDLQYNKIHPGGFYIQAIRQSNLSF